MKYAIRCLASAACLVFPVSHAAEPTVSSTFSDKGLSSLKLDGTEILANGVPVVQWITGAEGKPVVQKSSGSQFHAASKTLVVNYPWGNLTFVYESIPEGLRIVVRAENTGDQIITSLRVNLLSFRNLGEGKVPPQTVSAEVPAFTFYKGTNGSVILGAKSPPFPLMLDFAQDPKTKDLMTRFGFGGGRVVVDGVQLAEMLNPAAKMEFQFFVKAAVAGTDPMVLASDVLDEFRAANPAILKWPDRRPIFRAFFGGGLPKDQAVANLKAPDAVKPPEPDTKFADAVRQKIDGLISAAKSADAQGAILWDLEGGTFPHAITYIGDPRLIRLLNPQMDLVADEIFKRMSDAGLRTGVTLRPSRVIHDAEKNSAKHSYGVAADPFQELDAKVAYAKTRWGCTLFYVDTNFFWRPYGVDKKWQSGPISADVWRRLRTKYPDTLFIPEFTGTADYASVAGYGEADMGDYGMPAIARALYPDAFRVIVIEDADPSENFDRFVSALDHDNSLMTFGQGTTSFNTTMLRRMEEYLAMQKKTVPAVIAAAAPGDLAKSLTSGETAFQAARRLAVEPCLDAAPRLLEIVQSEGEAWAVRRAALIALGKVAYAPAIPVLLELLENRSEGLYGDAAKALVGQDASVEGLVVDKIRGFSTTKGRGQAIDQIGSLLVLRKASSKAPAIQEVFGTFPETDTQARRALITLIGELHNPDSETFLLPLLEEPAYAPFAAAALVRIGSATGVEKVKTAAKAAKDAGQKDLSDALNRALTVK